MDKAVALCSYVFDGPGSDSNYPLFRNIWIDYNNHNKKITIVYTREWKARIWNINIKLRFNLGIKGYLPRQQISNWDPNSPKFGFDEMSETLFILYF